MSGFWKGDAIALGIDLAAAGIRANAKASANLAATRALVADLEEVRLFNAGNLAEKHALREALARIQPDHPLIANRSLQEKIHEAGRKAMLATNTWGAARNAGTHFKY